MPTQPTTTTPGVKVLHCELCNAAAPSLTTTRYGDVCRPCAREVHRDDTAVGAFPIR